MNKINYDDQMQKLIYEIKKSAGKPKLLLHACCAPCSSCCIERLKNDFELTVYFYNPNMDTEEEYFRRSEEEIRLCKIEKVPVIIDKFIPIEFYDAISGYEDVPEGGQRCERCFHLRLKKTAQICKNNGFEYFTTSLTVSPLKNADLLNRIGEEVSKDAGIKFLSSDFKKRGGYQRSIELSKQYMLYRQNYCGCKFSKKDNVNF